MSTSGDETRAPLRNRFARVLVCGVAGGLVLASAGYVEGRIAFAGFAMVYQRLFPDGGGAVVDGGSTGVALFQAALGGILGGIALAILGVRRVHAWNALGPLLGRALAGTALGVGAGTLGGLAIGWALEGNPEGLFMGHFQGAVVGFLVGLVVSVMISIRRPGPALGVGQPTRPAATWAWRSAGAALAVGYIAACAAVFVLKKVEARGPDEPSGGTMTRKGQTAPTFRVVTLEGKAFDSFAPRRGPVLVDFFMTSCDPCVIELQRVEPEIWRKYRERGLDVIAIGVGHDEAELREFRAQKGFTFPIAADPDHLVFSRFAKQMVPRSYLIGSDGRIAVQTMGYAPHEFSLLEKAIEAELPDSEGPPLTSRREDALPGTGTVQ